SAAGEVFREPGVERLGHGRGRVDHDASLRRTARRPAQRATDRRAARRDGQVFGAGVVRSQFISHTKYFSARMRGAPPKARRPTRTSNRRSSADAPRLDAGRRPPPGPPQTDRRTDLRGRPIARSRAGFDRYGPSRAGTVSWAHGEGEG